MKRKSKISLPDFNELTKRISFVDVLSRYHLLEGMHKKGDQLRGICPIHQGAENKNSFSVNTVRKGRIGQGFRLVFIDWLGKGKVCLG